MTSAAAPRHTLAVGDAIANLIDRSSPRAALALVIAAVVAVMLVAPIGYLGGGNDDTHYLLAARCWAAHGACLPHDHWSSRWPLVAPLALVTRLLGESRATVGLVPLAYWAAGIGLLGWLGRLWFDRATGLVAALLLGALPIYTAAALQPWIDSVELAWQLAALVAASFAYQRQSRAIAILAGAFAGLAFEARDTSILFLGASALGWLALDPARRRILLWAIVGLAAAVGAEMLAYALATGDPLYRYALSLHHAAIPSAELPPGFDTRQSPMFNPAYIAAWRREAGVEIWWPIDPWLNLVASRRIGWLLGAALLLALAYRDRLEPEARRKLMWITGLALLVSVALVYVLAVDPKPRMFLDLASAAALVAAACVVAAWHSGARLLPGAVVAMLVALAVMVELRTAQFARGEAKAARWIAQAPDAIETDPATRSALLLVPGIDRVGAVGSGRRLRLAVATEGCAALAKTASVALVDHVGAAIGPPADLCLFEYVDPSVERR